MAAWAIAGFKLTSAAASGRGDLDYAIVDTIGVTCWIALAPLVLSLANDPVGADRRSGFEVLALSRGHVGVQLAGARVIASSTELALRLLPAVVVALLIAVLGRSWSLFRVAAGGLGFAIVAGVTLGLVANVCGALGAKRGRWLLLAVVLIPWALAEMFHLPGWSLPGALGAALAVLTGVHP